MIFASSTAAGGGSTMILMMVGLIAIMYFMMIRPQRKEQKRVQDMLEAMDVGDAVMTSSGFYGIIIDISDEDVIVEFGNNKNCRIPMKKEAIATVEKPGEATAAARDRSDEPRKTKRRGKEQAKEAAEKAEETAKDAAKDAKESVEEAAAEAVEDKTE